MICDTAPSGVSWTQRPLASRRGLRHYGTPMSFWTVLSLGFILGLRHATDADHVVAVSTIVSRSKTPRSAVAVGALWGVGHTLTILLVGGAIVVFGVVIPPALELGLELGVALMLMLLGAINVWGATVGRAAPAGAHTDSAASLRPLLVGIVHGLAGSAALALLVLGTIDSASRAVLYLAVFGAGTVAGMALLTLLVMVPVAAASRRFASLERSLAALTGAASLLFGTLLALRVVAGHG